MALHMLLDEPGGAGRGEAVMLCGHTESDLFAKVNPHTNHIKTWLHSDDRCIACVQEMHGRLPLSAEDMSVAVATRDPMTAVTHLWDARNHHYCAGEVGFYDHHAMDMETWMTHPSPCHACLVVVLKLLRVTL